MHVPIVSNPACQVHMSNPEAAYPEKGQSLCLSSVSVPLHPGTLPAARNVHHTTSRLR